jgi:hypothetical protein
MFQEFVAFLHGQANRRRRVILVVDEAQNLTGGMLEELRLLSNLNVDKSHVFQIILSGQPSLHTLVQGPDRKQFAQRVSVDHRLEPLDEGETFGYITHRLVRVGGHAGCFTDTACTLIHRISGGVPRIINQICDLALAYGFAQETQRITAAIVAEVITDRKAGGILPLSLDVDVQSLVASEHNWSDEIGALKNRAKSGANWNDQGADITHANQARDCNSVVQGNGDPIRARQGIRRMDPEALYQQGLALRKSGSFSEAVQVFEEAAEYAPYRLKALFQAGLCYRSTGRLPIAISTLRKILDDQQDVTKQTLRVQYALGRMLEEAHEDCEALECYRQISAMEAKFRDIEVRIARLSGDNIFEYSLMARALYHVRRVFAGVVKVS